MTAPTLDHAVEALDKLNSWVRAPHSHGEISRPKNAIYWIKGKLLNALTSAGRASHRLIVLEVKCRGCDGTDKWISWDIGRTNEPCRKCDATGVHKLWFVESRIDGGAITWHSPAPRGIFVRYPLLLRLDSLGVAQPVTDWKPNQPGRPMEAADVARCLNVVEEFIPERPGEYWTYDGGPFYTFHYSLFVGEQAKACFRCGKIGESVGSLCCTREAISWCGWICRDCDKTFDHRSTWSEAQQKYICPNSMFDACPFPLDLVTDPEIQQWQQRQLAYRAACERAKEEWSR